MRYIPHTPSQIRQMLNTIGVSSVDELFAGIPKALRIQEGLPLPRGLAEPELFREMSRIADKNIHIHDALSFLGAGAYAHYVPAVISCLVRRGEFLTAYTPYQAEVSQGTLQAIFEFQTMMCELTGMEVANASNYDLSTACAEAVLMAQRINKKTKVLVARTMHPHYREVLKTYFKNQNLKLIEIPFDRTGRLDCDALDQNLSDDVTAVLVQSPNFFGVIEELEAIGDRLKDLPGLFVVATAEALAYGILKSPGEVGADIAVGEGMSFGIGTNFGGPYLGIFATRERFVREMPGRLVGQTVDADGRTGYVLTLATREQHIRREKATSNICTNQGLCALICAIYLSLMGPGGLEKLALLNAHRLQELEALIKRNNPGAIFFEAPRFNETVVALNVPARDAVEELLKDKILAGVDLATYYPELKRHLLVCTTELVSADDVRVFADRLSRFV